MRALAGCLLLCTISGAAAAAPLVAAPAEEELGVWLGEQVFLAPKLQYRPRYVVHGTRDFKPDSLFNAVSHRARLGLELRALTWFSAGFQIQDVRTWGEETNSLGDYVADGLDVHQAWAEARCPLGLALRVGRQEVAFDNERLIGVVDWTDQGRVLDAVRLSLRRRRMEADLVYAKLSESQVLARDAAGKTVRGAPEDADLVAARGRFIGFAPVRPTLIAIYDRGANDQQRVTAGLFVEGLPWKGLKYSGELYYQAGRRHLPTRPAEDLSAFFGAVSVGYTAPVRTAPSLTLWYEHVSGDGDRTDTTVRTFDTLLATNHKFYGFMDLFLNLPVDTGGFGLQDLGGRLALDPARGLTLWIDFHHFEQAKKDPALGTKSFGNELDVLVRYKVNAYLGAEGVYGVFFPKLGLSNVRGGGTSTEHFGYLQIDFRI